MDMVVCKSLMSIWKLYRGEWEMIHCQKTYNTKDSPVVTDLSTTSLIKGERTGSHVSWWVWSYVMDRGCCVGLYRGSRGRVPTDSHCPVHPYLEACLFEHEG